MSSEERKGTVVVVEDDPIIARDIAGILTEAGFAVPAVTATMSDAIAAILQHSPDVALLDIGLGDGGTEGLEIARRLAQLERPRVVFVSGQSLGAVLAQAAGLDPAGFVTKPFTSRQVVAAVEVAVARARREGAAPRVPIAEQVLHQIADMLSGRDIASSAKPKLHQPPGWTDLTAREREVAELLLVHRRAPRVARELKISPQTVRNHLKAIFSKLGVHSQDDLIELLEPKPAGRVA